MTEYTGEEQRIPAYFRDSISRDEGYFRVKSIAGAVGLTVKQVGSRLLRLIEKSEGVETEKWECARSTTWRVTRS